MVVVCYISKTFKVHQNPCRRAEWVKNTEELSLNHIILFLVICVEIVSDCWLSFVSQGGVVMISKMLAPWCRLLRGRSTTAREPCTTHTYLAGETPWSWRWFTHGEAQPLHFGCADPCEFLKCGNLDCIICGSGGLRSRSPLIMLWKINTQLTTHMKELPLRYRWI